MYVKIKNGSVDVFPYTFSMLKKENPETSFPKEIPESVLASYDIYPVVGQDMPSDFNPRTQNINLSSVPTLIDSVWTRVWTITNKTQEEINEVNNRQAQMQRDHRSFLFAETDYWALSDTPDMTADQIAYREALRNIPTHSNWPWLEESDWPTKP